MSENNTEVHTHCWHPPTISLTLGHYPPRREEVCCHCGAHQWVPIPQPPIPDGHGPHYPRPFGTPISFPFSGGTTTLDPTARCSCRVENGGSGICNCVLSTTTVR